MNKITMSGALTKVDDRPDGTMYVAGIASAEVIDAAGEVVTSTAMRKAIGPFLERGSGPLREMHQLIAAGKVISMEVVGKATHCECLVVDPVAQAKVRAGVLRGLSIGGHVPPGGRNEADPSRIDRIVLKEISLVDSPACPSAMISVFKVDDLGDDGEPFALTPPTTEKAKGPGRGRHCDVCGDKAEVVLCQTHTVRPSKTKKQAPEPAGDVLAKLQAERDDLGGRLAKVQGERERFEKAYSTLKAQHEAMEAGGREIDRVRKFYRGERDAMAKLAAAVEARAEAAERERDDLRAAFTKAQSKGALLALPDGAQVWAVEKAGDVSGLTKAAPKPPEPATAADAIRQAHRAPRRIV